MNFHPLAPPVPELCPDRFHLLAIFGFRVFPIPPQSTEPLRTSHGFDLTTIDDCDDLAFVDASDCNVGIRCGSVSNVTALEISTNEADDWVLRQADLCTQRFWAPHARYYLFQYLDPIERKPFHPPVRGLRLVDDDDWIIGPGSMMADGRMVYWEVSPDEALLAELPHCLGGRSGS